MSRSTPVRHSSRFYVPIDIALIVLILSNAFTSLVWYKMGYTKGTEERKQVVNEKFMQHQQELQKRLLTDIEKTKQENAK